MHDLDERQGQGTVAAGISNAVVRLMSEYIGRGPTKARTAISRDVVTVLLQDTLTKAERSLAEAARPTSCSGCGTSSSARCVTTWSQQSRC